MKRFYKEVALDAVPGGFALHLDGRPVKTPMRKPLVLPGSALAMAVAAEWQAQSEVVDPQSMPLTGLANAAIDHVAADRGRFVGDIIAYAETDTLCYRAEPDDPLSARQDAQWEPLLRAVERHLDIALYRIAGIMHRRQPSSSIARLEDHVDKRSHFELASLSSLVGLTGSLIAPLALVDGLADADIVWDAVNLEELAQEEKWGADAEAIENRTLRRSAFDAAVNFCSLVQAKSAEPQSE